MPDIRMPDNYYSRFTNVLYGKGYIEDFANLYYKKHREGVDVDNFELSDADYNEFVRFMADKPVDFESETQQTLSQLRQKAERDKYLDRIEGELNAIEQKAPYSPLANILAGVLAASGFTLFFGGKAQDALCACLIGALIQRVSAALEKKKFPSFFSISLCSAMTAALAIAMNETGLAVNRDALIIGSLMLLVPGLAITNAVRDSLAGDLISGMSRAMEAMMIAIAVALGPGLVMSLWMMIGGLPL